MIKLLGCILLTISCSLMGCLKANSYKERSRELECIMEIIKLIDMYITYKKEPLSKTFHKVSECKKCWFSNILDDCTKHINNNNDLENAWKHAIKQHIDKCPLTDEDISIIEDMILGLGKSDLDGQRRILEPILLRLEYNYKAASAKEKSLGKMYRTLGVAAGIVTTIIII